MPFYEYRCPKCNHLWDECKSMSRCDEPVTCPQCSSQGDFRTFGGVNFRVIGGTNEDSAKYKIDKALGKAKDTRAKHQEKFGKYTEYIDTSDSVAGRSVVDPDEKTYLGNVSQKDMDQVFDEMEASGIG